MVRRLAALNVALITVFPMLTVAQGPPEARRGSQVDVYHETSVEDPYRWMERLQSKELQAWMRAQDEYRTGFLGDARLAQRIQERMDAIANYRRQGIPVRKGNYTFSFSREAGEDYNTLYVRESSDTHERQLLDIKTLSGDSMSVRVNSFSPDGRHLTYHLSAGQSRRGTEHILRVENGELLPETLTGFLRGRSNVAWSADGTGFFYTRYPVQDDPQAPIGTPQIYYHTVGRGQAQDVLVYERPQDQAQLAFNLRVSHDGRYLILSGSVDGGGFNGLYDRLFYKDLEDWGDEVVELFVGVGATYAFEGNRGDHFWIRTTHQAPRARIVEVDINHPTPTAWTEIIPEADGAMRSASVIGERLVVQYVLDAREIARVYDFAGRLHYEIDHLSPTMGGFADDPGSSETFYSAGSMVDPSTYHLDVHTGESSVAYQREFEFDSDAFVTTQVFYESADGTRVPMFLVHRKDLQLDGSNPLFMYAYGAWAWSAYPWQIHMYTWLEMGGVYAVANIRGGGEYGESWHKAGIRRNKQNGIDDFIAAAEWLIEHEYTSPARMIANGGSASGILPAAAMIQRPDLFGAAVINFPTLDQLRYTEFGSARSWIPEFGDPADPGDFAALYAYSPYHNLNEGVCYPPTWVQVGENDDLTTPMHGYKFVARLQAIQECDNPVVLKIAWGAGHAYGASPEQARQTQAEELAFLVRVLRLDVESVLEMW